MLLDRDEKTVSVFDEAGKPLRSPCRPGAPGYELKQPVDVAVDPFRNLYVADEEGWRARLLAAGPAPGHAAGRGHAAAEGPDPRSRVAPSWSTTRRPRGCCGSNERQIDGTRARLAAAAAPALLLDGRGAPARRRRRRPAGASDAAQRELQAVQDLLARATAEFDGPQQSRSIVLLDEIIDRLEALRRQGTPAAPRAARSSSRPTSCGPAPTTTSASRRRPPTASAPSSSSSPSTP